MLRKILNFFEVLLGDKFFLSKKNIVVFVVILFFCICEMVGIGKDWHVVKKYIDMQKEIDKTSAELTNEKKIVCEQLEEIAKKREVIVEKLKKLEKETESNRSEIAKLNKEVRSTINTINRLLERKEYYRNIYFNTSWWSYNDFISATEPIENELNSNRRLRDKKYKRINELNKKNSTIKKEREVCDDKDEEFKTSSLELEKKLSANEFLIGELQEKKQKLKVKYEKSWKSRIDSVHYLPSIMLLFLAFFLLLCLVFRFSYLEGLHGLHKEIEQLVAN